MEQIFAQIIGFGLPLVIALCVALFGVLTFVGVGTAPRWPVIGMCLLIMIAPASSGYGLVNADDKSMFYVKGSGTFFFSFLEWAVMGFWFTTVILARTWAPHRQTWLPSSKYYLLFGGLFAFHVISGLFANDHSLALDFGRQGVIFVLMQGMFLSLVLTAIRTKADLRILMIGATALILARDTFGLLRFVFGHGDPQNAYEMFESKSVKITFWDINDSVYATFLAAYAIWRVLVERVVGWKKLLFVCAALVAISIPVFSARRTGQGGMLIAFAALLYFLPAKRRWPLLISIILIIPVAVAVTSLRSAGKHQSLVDSVLIDVKNNPYADHRRTRFYELQTAWQTMKHNLVLGGGPSATFNVYNDLGLEYHSGNYGFVHSGVGHLVLKTGLVGAGLYILAIGSALFRRNRFSLKDTKDPYNAIRVGAFCGVLASFPTVMFGTPIIDIRTMLTIGLLLAMSRIGLPNLGAKPAVANQQWLIARGVTPKMSMEEAPT